MIYEYKGRRVVAKDGREAARMLHLDYEIFKKNAVQVEYKLNSDKAKTEIKDNYDKLKRNNAYTKKLETMLKKEGGTDANMYQKIVVAQLKDNPCAICGKEFIPSAMCFHHCEPTLKKFEIRTGRIRMKHLQEEVAKTILICLVCHAYVHRAFEMANVEDGLKAMQEYYERCENEKI